MDWFDEYLNELTSERKVSYPPDQVTFKNSAKGKLIFDSFAESEREHRLLIEKARRELETPRDSGGDSAYERPYPPSLPVYENDTIYLTSVKSSGNVEITLKSTTGFAVITWWDGTRELGGTGVVPDNIVLSKAITNGAEPKDMVIYCCNGNNYNKTGTFTDIVINNQDLTKFNTGNCDGLVTLDLQYNSLTTIDLLKCDFLVYLDIAFNPDLSNLYIDNLSQLQIVHLNDTVISDLELISLEVLTEIDVTNTRIVNLNVSSADTLINIYGGGNSYLSSITLGHQPYLTTLDVMNSTSLASLDVSDCDSLQYIGAHNCGLTSITVNGLVGLFSFCDVFIHDNYLTETTINSFFNNLGTIVSPGFANIDVSNNPGSSTCDKTIAEAKGWNVTV